MKIVNSSKIVSCYYYRQLFLCPPKNWRQYNQHFELPIFMINLHFIKLTAYM